MWRTSLSLFRSRSRCLAASRSCSLIRQTRPLPLVRASFTTGSRARDREQAGPRLVDSEGAPVRVKPKYQITFTCKACDERSTHEMTKQAYHRGTVLIQCPKCKNRHLIADNLRIFGDKDVNVEDLLREKGELVRRGSLSTDGDIELYAESESDDPPLSLPKNI